MNHRKNRLTTSPTGKNVNRQPASLVQIFFFEMTGSVQIKKSVFAKKELDSFFFGLNASSRPNGAGGDPKRKRVLPPPAKTDHGLRDNSLIHNKSEWRFD